MKRAFSILVIVILAISLAACGSEEKSEEELKKEEEAKAKRAIFIEDHYKLQKAFGYRFKLPKELKYDKTESEKEDHTPYDACKYYSKYGANGYLVEGADITKMSIDADEIDNIEAMETFLDSFETSKNVSDVGKRENTTIAGYDAIVNTYKLKAAGIIFKCKIALWVDDEKNLFTMVMQTAKKNLNKFKYVLDTVIIDKKNANTEREIYIDDHYKTAKVFGYRIKIPNKMQYNKKTSKTGKEPEVAAAHYDIFNDSGIVTDSIDIERIYSGEDGDYDKQEALDSVEKVLEKSEYCTSIGDKKSITVAGVEAVELSYKSTIAGIKFRNKVVSWVDDNNYLYRMTITTTKKNFDDYKFIFDEIIQE